MTTEKDKAREPFKALCTETVMTETDKGYSVFFLSGEVYNSCNPEVYPPPGATATVASIDHQGEEHFMDWKWFHEHFEKLPQ